MISGWWWFKARFRQVKTKEDRIPVFKPFFEIDQQRSRQGLPVYGLQKVLQGLHLVAGINILPGGGGENDDIYPVFGFF